MKIWGSPSLKAQGTTAQKGIRKSFVCLHPYLRHRGEAECYGIRYDLNLQKDDLGRAAHEECYVCVSPAVKTSEGIKGTGDMRLNLPAGEWIVKNEVGEPQL